MQGEGALPLMQLSINFKLSCWNRRTYKLCSSKQLILKLIDNCKSGSVPCIEISLQEVTRNHLNHRLAA